MSEPHVESPDWARRACSWASESFWRSTKSCMNVRSWVAALRRMRIAAGRKPCEVTPPARASTAESFSPGAML